MNQSQRSRSLFDAGSIDTARLLERTQALRPVYVVIPVFNGGSAVARCLDSLRAFTPNTRLVVIDDASTDPDVIADLDQRAAHHEIELIRHAENWGYTRTANHGLRLSDSADVVLLNSDTQVGPLWLENLRLVAYSRDSVATVSALSDNAGAMAMPKAGTANTWPAHLTWPEIARAAFQADLPWSLEAPTGHGFCMLVTRDAIEEVGAFDEAAFPRGYGEENDFCMRARAVGLVNLIAPRVFVKHVRSQSFGQERDELIRSSRSVIDARHPHYTALVREWLDGREMRELRASFGRLRDELTTRANVRPRHLYVVHRSGGGTPATNLDLMTALTAYQESFLLEAGGQSAVDVSRVNNHGQARIARWQPDPPFAITDMWRADYAEAFAALVLNLGIELVHVRHLIQQPLTTVPTVAARLRRPLVLSTHDFYMSCPSIHLLDENDRFCGGAECSPGPGECRRPTRWVEGAPPLKHNWVHEWRQHARTAFGLANAVVATTTSASSILTKAHPQLAGEIRIIEHGRDLEENFAPIRTDESSRLPGPPRILALGNWAAHKGTRYLDDVARHVGPHVEWHVAGGNSEQFGDIAVTHGTYEREFLRRLVAEIDPDLAAIFSIWPETYSHTLTEAWAFGLPVLATDIGAVAERIRRDGGGILLPVDDPSAAAEAILDLVSDQARIAELRQPVPRLSVRSRTAMAEDYRDLYADVGAIRAPKKIAYITPHQQSLWEPRSHFRLLSRLDRAVSEGLLAAKQIPLAEIDRGASLDGFASLVILGDALEGCTDWAISEAKRTGTRLVVDVSHDALDGRAERHQQGSTAEQELLRADFTRLLAHADCVTTSSELLTDRLRGWTDADLVVVPSQVDPRVHALGSRKRRNSAAVTRILYIGSGSHNDDLTMMSSVLDKLRQAYERELHLEVVGVPGAETLGASFSAVQFPESVAEYPEAFRWLAARRHRWALAVAPLSHAAARQGADDLRLLEYASLELPTVASHVGPYRGLDELALIVENDLESWIHAIRTLLSDREGAARRARAARDYVHSRWQVTEGDQQAWLRALLGPGTGDHIPLRHVDAQGL